MSAPLAGKFQDHYEVLGIADPRASSETIQKAYTQLAQKYRPMGDSPDAEQFAAVNHAYEILTDPQSRREFDKVKGIGEDTGTPKFSADFFGSLGRDAGLRAALLSILYDRRRSKPFTPSLSMRHLENMLVASVDELNFTLWFLKQKGLAVTDDKSSIQITAEGMDWVEATQPTAELVMPLIRVQVPVPEKSFESPALSEEFAAEEGEANAEPAYFTEADRDQESEFESCNLQPKSAAANPVIVEWTFETFRKETVSSR